MPYADSCPVEGELDGVQRKGEREGVTLHEYLPCGVDIISFGMHPHPVRLDRGSHPPDEDLEAQRG